MRQGSRQFRAALSELDQMMKWVREVLLESFSSSSKAKKFELAVEEALVNVIHYAYPHPPGVVEVGYRKEAKKLFFIIKDHGLEFNPLEEGKPPNLDAPLEERDAGGLGIHFIKNMTDAVDYQRIDGWNVLTLVQII